METTKELMNGEEEFISRRGKKTHITVFVTKSCNFRAHIDEPRKPNYEVTINGKSWKEGKGQKHKKRIIEKMNQILNGLQAEAVSVYADNIT